MNGGVFNHVRLMKEHHKQPIKALAQANGAAYSSITAQSKSITQNSRIFPRLL